MYSRTVDGGNGVFGHGNDIPISLILGMEGRQLMLTVEHAPATASIIGFQHQPTRPRRRAWSRNSFLWHATDWGSGGEMENSSKNTWRSQFFFFTSHRFAFVPMYIPTMTTTRLLLLCIAFLTVASGFTVQPMTTIRSPVSCQLHPDQGELLKEYAKEHLKEAATKARQIQKPNVFAWCRKIFASQKTKGQECPRPTKWRIESRAFHRNTPTNKKWRFEIPTNDHMRGGIYML